uniref:Uncharacterized protein n=1 Tax=Capra hircus TaxID=9925 RepID=A0A8C2S261_CAPHI
GGRCGSRRRGWLPLSGVGLDAKAPFPFGFPPPQTIPGAVNPVAGAAARRSEGQPAPSTMPVPVRRASSRKSPAWTPSGTRDKLGHKLPRENKKQKNTPNNRKDVWMLEKAWPASRLSQG